MNKNEFTKYILEIHKENESFLNKIILSVSMLSIPLLATGIFNLRQHNNPTEAKVLFYFLLCCTCIIIIEVVSLIVSISGCENILKEKEIHKQMGGSQLKWGNGMVDSAKELQKQSFRGSFGHHQKRRQKNS